MNYQKYTSLEMSIWLDQKELKFDNPEYFYYKTTAHDFYLIKRNRNQTIEQQFGQFWEHNQYYPAYDIINDLCIKYGKQIFGTENTEFFARFVDAGMCVLDAVDYAILQISSMLRFGENEKAEQYIIDNFLPVQNIEQN